MKIGCCFKGGKNVEENASFILKALLKTPEKKFLKVLIKKIKSIGGFGFNIKIFRLVNDYKMIAIRLSLNYYYFYNYFF